jgi:hypothetical protein
MTGDRAGVSSGGPLAGIVDCMGATPVAAELLSKQFSVDNTDFLNCAAANLLTAVQTAKISRKISSLIRF